MKIEDKLLVQEIRKRNREVFEALFYDYYPKLTRFAERFVFDRRISEDVVQNLFISIWERAETLAIDRSIKAYLYYSVRNRCLNYLKSLKVQDQHHILYVEAALNEDHFDEEDAEILKQIDEAIDKLPDKMAEIFRLKYVEELTVKQIAGQLEVSENTVKTQLLRAKDKLRKLLHESSHLKFFL